MTSIRVLHCLCRVGSGGVEQRLPLLLDYLPRDRFVHEVVCQDAFGELPRRLAEKGCAIHEIGKATSLLSPLWYARAISLARNFRPDVVHGGVIEGNALANVIGLTMPRVKVISEETSHPTTRKKRTDIFLRLMLRRSDAVIGVSPIVVDYLRCNLHIHPCKLRLINNGVADATHVTRGEVETLRAELKIPPGARVIGSVGRLLDKPKRFSDLIRAIPGVREKVANAYVLIVGDGDDKQMLELLAKQLGVGDAVIFAGYRGNPRPLYALMDVFVLASEEEAFGLVLVEAMLAGVPVIGTSVGGIPFVLGFGTAGMLVPPHQPDCISHTIIGLLSNETRRAELARAGKSFAQAHFSARRYATEMRELYEELLLGHAT